MKAVSKYLSLSFLSVGLISAQTAAIAEVSEQERNDPVSIAQFVTPGMDGFELSAVLGVLGGTTVDDLDFFRFFGQAGDVVTIDIDGGMGGQQSVDTILAVFGDAPNFQMLRMNDDSYPVDEGSISGYDSRIVDFVLPSTGTYYVGVSHYPRFFQDGGSTRAGAPRNGDYRLLISGVTDPVLHINIAVKPGNREVAPLNPRARGVVPVALLSGEDFDPADVDVDSLTFGHSGDEAVAEKCHKAGDFNKDGVKDLVCHFDNQSAGFNTNDLEGVLQGSMKNGKRLEGRGLLKVVPQMK